MAVLASAGTAAVVSGLRDEAAGRRRAQVRAAELANLAAAAQRWRLTPAVLGGPTTGGFADVSFDALGLRTRLFRPHERRTAHGIYQLVAVPACPTLDAAAARAGLDAGGDGLLVVGHDPVSGEDAAVVVLSPLVQIPLARVPRAWIAELSRAVRPTLEAQPVPEAVPAPRAPARPEAAADRPAVGPPTAPLPSPLRLVGWPPRPSAPLPETGTLDPPPLRRLTAWRRAA